MSDELRVYLPGEPVGPLSETEAVRFAQHEQVIERGWRHFIEVGEALIDIRDQQLYREQYQSFTDYMRLRWDMPVSRAYQQMRAASAMHFLAEIEGVTVMPKNELVARTLGSLISQGQDALVAEAWARAVTMAEGRPPTAAQTEKAIREVRYEHSHYGQRERVTGEGPKVLPDVLLRDVHTVIKSAIRNLRGTDLPPRRGLEHLDLGWRRKVRRDLDQLVQIAQDVAAKLDAADDDA